VSRETLSTYNHYARLSNFLTFKLSLSNIKVNIIEGMHTISKLVITSLATVTLAHPGEHHESNQATQLSKQEFNAHARRGLSECAAKLQSRGGAMERAAARRASTVAHYRKTRGLFIRDTNTILNTSHLSTQ
jgi:hypothetical protein